MTEFLRYILSREFHADIRRDGCGYLLLSQEAILQQLKKLKEVPSAIAFERSSPQ